MDMLPGVTRVVGAADAAVGTSGANIRIYTVHLYGATGACSCVLRQGTTDSGTPMAFISAGAGASNTVNFAGGLLFTGGCFLDQSFGAADQATIIYSKQI